MDGDAALLVEEEPLDEAKRPEAKEPEAKGSGAKGPDGEEPDGEEPGARRGRHAVRQKERRQRPAWARPAALGALAGLLLAAGLVMRVATPAAGEQAVAANQALIDKEATTKVAGDVSTALAAIFTYSPARVEATERAAADVLDGKAAEDYTRLMAQIKRDVITQQATLTTKVVRAGVVSLTASDARLLVFLDQSATREGKSTGPAVPAQLTVTARLDDGRWRITDITSSKAAR
ncbi:hypothetical protein OIE66_11805 [Nonomuraea sp. NBC_01738]|uniref:hypothetical protein n=1 Tax=Nonomuraea sp. NBC_01738 TaxID=2976003 RepID=UPI002E12F717|nr:hypothetical protein OIE66_11805 [Nonomuraea sp. NBC_01738]